MKWILQDKRSLFVVDQHGLEFRMICSYRRSTTFLLRARQTSCSSCRCCQIEDCHHSSQTQFVLVHGWRQVRKPLRMEKNGTTKKNKKCDFLTCYVFLVLCLLWNIMIICFLQQPFEDSWKVKDEARLTKKLNQNSAKIWAKNIESQKFERKR